MPKPSKTRSQRNNKRGQWTQDRASSRKLKRFKVELAERGIDKEAAQGSDKCDYCNDKGWYLMDGQRNECFCKTQESEET